MFERFLYRLVYILFAFVLWMSMTNPAKADNVLVVHQYYGGAHTNVGSRLTTEGHTVTYASSLPSSVSGYDQIWDLSYSTAYSSTQITTLNNFVQNGGFLMMNGENSGFAARNNSIASVVSAAGGGTLTFGSASNSYTVINSDFSDDTGTVTGAAGSGLTNSQGQYVFKTTSGVIGGMIWTSSDLGSGYSGAIFVTADINMWDSSYGSTLLKVNITDDIIDMETAGTLYVVATPTYSSAPTSAQLQKRTDTRNITNSGNSIYIDQAGTNLDLDVIQDADDNLIAGTSTTSITTSDANISGDYNTVNLSQKSDNNVLLFGVNGDHNDLTVSQGDNVNDTGGHRAIVDVTGNYNSTSLTQYDTGFGSGQFADINISGNDNTITSAQRETDKMLFIDVNGSDNTITTDQKDSGQHFLDITVGSNQTVSVTQQGTGDHAATVDMGGYSAGLSLDQNSSTDQNYVLEQTCANVSGCGTTTVTQN